MPHQPRRIAIIGAGAVGSTIAYACLIRGVARHLAIYDLNADRVRAEVLDLNHGLNFVPSATIEGGADLEICRGADVVVVTAGAKQQPGQTRMDLAAANAAICRDLVPRLLPLAPDALYLMVTNPVDVITGVFGKLAGLPVELPKSRVLGSGTVLDSSRFRFLLALRLGVAVQNVHGYIVGEHGDSEIALWSGVSIGGVPLSEWKDAQGRTLGPEDQRAVFEEVRTAAYQIIKGKGATNYAIGLSTARILDALLHDERGVMPVSAPVGSFPGLEGLEDICLSLPRVVDGQGAGAPLPVAMSDAERSGLRRSAETIRAALAQLGF